MHCFAMMSIHISKQLAFGIILGSSYFHTSGDHRMTPSATMTLAIKTAPTSRQTLHPTKKLVYLFIQ